MGLNGIINTVAGAGVKGFSGDGGPARLAMLSQPKGITVSPNGSLYIADRGNHRIRRVGLVLPGVGEDEYLISSDSGRQLYHFDAIGRHLRTIDTTTGAVIYQFRYDTEGHLSEIEDVDGNVTLIERSGETLTAIVAPDGQRTALTLDVNGYLDLVTDPTGEQYLMAYPRSGLQSGDFFGRLSAVV